LHCREGIMRAKVARGRPSSRGDAEAGGAGKKRRVDHDEEHDEVRETLGDGHPWDLQSVASPDVQVVGKEAKFANLFASLNDPQHCNVVLHCPDGEDIRRIYAHSLALCDSPYFQTLMDPSSGFRETWEDRWRVIKCPEWADTKSMLAALEFLYTGVPGKRLGEADGRRVYALAELMLMPPMEEYLRDCVNVHQWTAAWEFSKHGREKLQQRCIEVLQVTEPTI